MTIDIAAIKARIAAADLNNPGDPLKITLARKEFIAHARTDIPALIAALEAAERERDEYRAKLMNLADAQSVKGMSWGGFNVIGDDKSIDAVQSAIHYGGQIDEYRAAFLQRKAALEAERDALKAENQKMVTLLGHIHPDPDYEAVQEYHAFFEARRALEDSK